MSDYHTTKKMKKRQIIVNKAAYLRLVTLGISKIVIYEFWYIYQNQNMETI